MERNLRSDEGSADMRFIASGVSADLYALGDGQVVKLFRASVSDEMIAREAAMSAFAHAAGLAAAPALGQCVMDGRRGIRYPHLDGDTLMDRMRRQPGSAARLLDDMAALQRAMHDVAAVDARAVKQVLETDILYGPAPAAAQRAMVDYIRALPDGTALLHGDFHPGNIMATSHGPVVIDWSKAAAGHPAADLVRSEMLLRFGIGPNDWITNLWRDWAAARLRRSYIGASPVGPADLAQWRPAVAMAWLRSRSAGRSKGFARYLNRAMRQVGLTPLSD